MPLMLRPVSLALCLFLALPSLSLAQPAATPESRLEELAQLRAQAQAMNPASAYLKARHAQAEGDLEVAYIYMNRVYQEQGGNEDLAGKLFFLAMSTGHIAKAAEVSALIPEDSNVGYLGQLAQIAAAVKAGRLDAAAEVPLSSNLPLFEGRVNDLVRAWLDVNGEGATEVIEALSALDEDAEEDRRSPRNLLHAALLRSARGEQEEAAALLRASLDISPALRQVRALASVEMALGNASAARAAYDLLDADNTTQIDLELDFARIEAGEPPAPLPGTAVQGLARVFYDIAGGFNQVNSPDLATMFSQMALYLDGDIALARLLLGNVLIQRGNYTDADDVLLSVSDQDPLWFMSDLRAADAMALADDTPEAIALLTGLLEQRPEDVNVLARLGDLHRGQREFDTAIDLYTRAIDLLGDEPAASDWDIFYSRGVAHERTDQWPKAEADFKAALALEPDQPFVLNYLGYSWADRGENLDEALEMIRRAVRQRPRDGFLIDSLGWAYYRLERYDEALIELEKAVSLEPLEADIVDHYGDVLWQQGRRREARFQWQRALGLAEEDDPRNEELIQTIAEKLETGL